MGKIDDIRRNNEAIYEMINSIIKKYNGDVPKKVMEEILTAEQRNVVASYLAMYDDMIFDKDILKENDLGNVQISKSCASGLNHKTKAVIIGDMSAQIQDLRKKEKYGSNKDADITEVEDMPTYIKYMTEKGGTELEFYLTTLPHEARHLMGVEGNSGFPDAKGFAEGKNELDTRRAMEYFGFKYYAKRNYSKEVAFVEYLEEILGKDSVDELGSFKPLEYAKLTKDFGEVFRDFVDLKDQNSIKKDVKLYFELNGRLDVHEGTSEYQEKAAEIVAERKKEIELFREKNGIDKTRYEEMNGAYKEVDDKRRKKLEEMLDRIPPELKPEIERLIKEFDRIHGISSQNKMVKAYDSVDLTVIESHIDSRKLRQNTEETRIDDDKLDSILQVQKAELKQLSIIYNPKKFTKDEINTVANNPEVAEEVAIAQEWNDKLSIENNRAREGVSAKDEMMIPENE